MQCIKVLEVGKPGLVNDAPIPEPGPGYVQVKIKAVALNPTDWKHAHVSAIASLNHSLGCDYVGHVTALGGPDPITSTSPSQRFKVGDRIAGMIHGGHSANATSGAFATYGLARASAQFKVPESVSDEDAACLGVGVVTVGQGLFLSLGLPLPSLEKEEKRGNEAKKWLLIYGGSTATGLLAIQFALQAGLRVVTTCSPRNFDLVKSLGAEAAFDYSDVEKCGREIREFTGNGCKYAFDCVSEGSSAAVCDGGLSSEEGVRYSAILNDGKANFKGLRPAAVHNAFTLAYTALGEPFAFGPAQFPAKPDDLKFMADVMVPLTEKLLNEKKLRLFPLKRGGDGKGKGGLVGVLEGLEELKAGKVSGGKLVYAI